MENYETLQSLADILYNIYVKTYTDRKIVEANYVATQQLLQLSNEFEDRYIADVSESPEKECLCKKIETSDNNTNQRENQIVQDIEMAITKAKNLRLNDKKLKSPYVFTQNGKIPKLNIPRISSAIPTKMPNSNSLSTLTNISKKKPLNKLTTSQKTLQTHHGLNYVNSPRNTKLSSSENPTKFYTIKTKSTPGMKFQHVEPCPKNKNSKLNSNKTDLSSRSRISVGYPASLETVRIPSEVQRALKIYYKFVNDKDIPPSNRKSKMKSLFLQKLDMLNTQSWDSCQKEDFKKMFELNVYINTYESREDNVPSSSLCQFYSHEETLIGFQQSVNKLDRMMFYREIFNFLNMDFSDFLTSPDCSRNILPLLYKCIVGIVNVYNSGKFQNIAVIRPTL